MNLRFSRFCLSFSKNALYKGHKIEDYCGRYGFCRSLSVARLPLLFGRVKVLIPYSSTRRLHSKWSDVMDGLAKPVFDDEDEDSPSSIINNKLLEVNSSQELDSLICETIGEFDPVNVTTALSQHAFLHTSQSPEVFSSIATLEEYVLHNLKDFDAHGFASALMSFAKLRHSPSPKLLSCLESTISERISEFSGNDISMLMWACAMFPFRLSSTLLCSLEEQVRSSVSNLTPSALSSVLWAFLKLGHKVSPKFLADVDVEYSKHVLETTPGSAKFMLWVLIKLEHPISRELLALTETRIIRSLDQFQVQDISNLIWCFSKAKYSPSASTMETFEWKISQEIGGLDDTEFVTLLWSLSRLDNSLSNEMIDKIEEVIRYGLSKFPRFLVPHVVFGYASLNRIPSKPVFDSLMHNVLTHVDKFGPMDFSRLLEGLVNIRALPTTEALNIIERAFSRAKHGFIKTRQRTKAEGALQVLLDRRKRASAPLKRW